MINSMTGFGTAEGQFEDTIYVVEIKSVNNRYFKARTKLPEPVAFLEESIERLLREHLRRGSINYTLRLKNVSGNIPFEIDEKSLQTLMAQLGRLASSADIQCHIDLACLLSVPGVLMPVSPDKEKADLLKDFVLTITQKAVEQLEQMRAAEGACLAADLKKHCLAMRKDLDEICIRTKVLPQEYAKKLKKRADSLLAEAKLKLDEETLAREVAVFAERSDVSEELARLDSHLQQFTKSCRADGEAGRRLDFISQEMLREANTIASKACDIEIVNRVVDMKCQIDRIKEQVQNVQ